MEAIKNFDFKGELKSVGPFGCGHINDTYLLTFALEDQSECKIILQKMNKNVFPKPVELMENVMGVTTYLKKLIDAQGGDSERETLNVIPAKDGKAYAAVYDVSVETGNLTIMKKINKSAIRKDEGDPIFTFKITNESTGKVYYKTLRFGGNETSSKEGMFDITEKTTLCGLPQGIYRVEELKTMGFTIKDYAVGGETNCDSFASADYIKTAIGLCAGENADWNSKEGFTNEPDDGHLSKNLAKVVVRNKKTRSSGKLTDTDVVKNHFVLGAPVEKKPDADNDCNMFVWK